MTRRWSWLAAVLIVGMLAVVPRAAVADSGPPNAPTNLSMTRAGTSTAVTPGGWIAAGKIDLHFHAQVTSGAVTPQVELHPSTTPFTGSPTTQGHPLSSTADTVITVSGLSNGKAYHWQARLVDGTGAASAWVPFTATPTSSADFGVDMTAPTRPIVASPTDPNQARWYHNRVITVRWSAIDASSGVQGYAFAVQRRAGQVPSAHLSAATGARVSNLADGVWYVAVRAIDRAGNWSRAGQFRLQLDRQTPRITWLSPARFTFNPYKGPTTVRFRVSEAASTRVQLWRVGARTPIAVYSFPHLRAGAVASITWSGRSSRGALDPGGYYFFAASAVDRAGNIARVHFGGIRLSAQKPQVVVGGVTVYPSDGKRIIIVLSRQTLYAYNGDRLALQTYVTTGNPALPTPTGSYHIMARYHPFEFISPWPPGSPYYYAPSWTQYAMLFRDGGYFIHDAPWRSAFGPGTNGPGQPGTNYGGTHGCVNVPPTPMLFLWNWTPIGTAVDVVN